MMPRAEPKSHRRIGSSFCAQIVNRLAFILCPGADVRRRQVAHVCSCRNKAATHFDLAKSSLAARQTLPPQAIKVDPLLPIDSHRSVRFNPTIATS